MFHVKFVNLFTAAVVGERDFEFIPENADIYMLGNDLYSVIKTKYDAKNNVITDVSALVLPI